MDTRQRTITDFFTPRRTGLITDYFKPESHFTKKRSRCLYQSKRDYKKARQYALGARAPYDASEIRNGYFYCTSANFTDYEVYTAIDLYNPDTETFTPRGTLVGQGKIDSDSALAFIEVDASFRRRGIGRYLIHFMSKTAPQFHVYTGIENNSRYRLTEDGAALVRSCYREGILDDEQILGNVPSSPTPSYS